MRMSSLFFLMFFALATSVQALEPPTGLQAAPTADGIQLKWTLEDAAGVKGVNVYRSASDPNAEFKQLAKVSKKTVYLDKSAKNGETYYYYVVATGAAGKASNKSELASATAGGTGKPDKSGTGTAHGHKGGVLFDFGAKLANFDPHTVAFSYDPKTGDGAWTDNCTNNKYCAWHAFEPFRLPAGLQPDDQVTFGAKPGTFICWVWSPESGKLRYAYCRDTVRFEEWTKFPYDLPKPPNYGPETVIRFDDTKDLMFFVAYNPKDGSLYMSRSTGDMFTNWMPFGTLLAPPNYDSATTALGFGAIQVEYRKKQRSVSGYWMYAYNAKASTFFNSFKEGDTEWNGWTPCSQLFLQSPLLQRD